MKFTKYLDADKKLNVLSLAIFASLSLSALCGSVTSAISAFVGLCF